MLGLTDDDIALIETQASKMIEGLQKTDEDYLEFKTAQIKKADELRKATLEKLAEAQVDYELKVKEVKGADKGTAAEKEKALQLLQNQYGREQADIRNDYQEKLSEINEKILAKDKDLSEKRLKIIEDEVEKQVELREDAEERTQELATATQKIYQDAYNQRLLNEAERSGDRIAIIRTESKIVQDEINFEIQAEREATQAKLAEIDKQLEGVELLASTRKALEDEKIALIEEAEAKINSLQSDRHEQELERIEKEQDANRDMFEEQLGFLSEILGDDRRSF
jgi:hypothetical protein